MSGLKRTQASKHYSIEVACPLEFGRNPDCDPCTPQSCLLRHAGGKKCSFLQLLKQWHCQFKWH